MKARLMAGVLAVVMAVSFASAQDFATSVGAKSKAMLFTLQGLATLGAGDFNGGFGAKYYLSNAMALRLGLGLTMANENLPLATGQSGTEGSISSTGFGVSAAVEYHLLPTRVSPYVGAGVGFSSITTNHEYLVIAPATFQRTTENNTAGELINGTRYTAGTAFNVGGILGVEFFVTKEISLGAEYQVGYTMISAPDMVDNTAPGVSTTTISGGISLIGIGAANATGGVIADAGKLTLSVYF
jgi:opacity protein-like surface antigen